MSILILQDPADFIFFPVGKIPREFFPFNICDINLHCCFLNQSQIYLLFLIKKTSSLDLDPLCNVRKVTLTALKVGKA
jgi:hypothetical protein